MENILITGANRSFGLEFTRQYAIRGDHIFATCRNPATAHELQSLKTQYPEHITILSLDVSNPASIDASYQEVHRQTNSLDILINNAGIRHSGGTSIETSLSERFGTLTYSNMVDVLQVNAVAPVIITQRYVDLLRASNHPRIVNLSSWLGSIGERTPDFDGDYSYSASKSALNMFSRIMSFTLAKDNIIVVPLDPGWARTDMGGEEAPQAVDESISKIITLIDHLTMEQSGHYLLWEGGETAW